MNFAKTVTSMKYNKEFKLKALRMWEVGGHNATEIAKKLGINKKSIMRWVKELKYDVAPGVLPPEKTPEEKARIEPTPEKPMAPDPAHSDSIEDLKKEIIKQMNTVLKDSKNIDDLARALKVLFEINPFDPRSVPKKSGKIAKNLNEKKEAINSIIDKINQDAKEVNSSDGDS